MQTEHGFPPAYNPYLPTTTPGPARHHRGGGRLGRLGGRRRNQLVGAVALVLAWLLMTALGPGRGLLVIVLLWVLVRALGARLDDGGRREWLRALLEYAVVAVLVVTVMTVMPAPAPTKPTAPARRPPAAAEQAKTTDSWDKLRARWDRLVDRVSAEAPVIQFPPAKERR